MNKFKYYFILLLAGISLVSCNKSDDNDVVTVPLRDYAEQYKADNDSIIKYLKTNYITVTNNPGTPQDQDVVIKKIVAGDGNVSIWDQTTYPLETRDVYSNDVTYKVYYLTLRKGLGQSPTNTDKVVTSYSGNLLDNTVFETSYGYATNWFLFPYGADTATDKVTRVEGWSEIFPKFKTGTSKTDPNSGVITYSDFGAGVMFLPSGLAYYAGGSGSVPAYTPVVFSFKLFDLQRMDNEFTVSSTTGQVVFNNKKFSYKAAFNQNERQLKSAGSFLLGGGVYFTKISSDSSFVHKTRNSLRNFQFGVSGGYAYTWAINKRWFASGSATVGANFGTERINDFGKQKIEIYPTFFPRIATGYNKEKWSLGLSYINNLIFSSFSESTNSNVGLSSGNFQIAYIWRFDSNPFWDKKKPKSD